MPPVRDISCWYATDSAPYGGSGVPLHVPLQTGASALQTAVAISPNRLYAVRPVFSPRVGAVLSEFGMPWESTSLSPVPKVRLGLYSTVSTRNRYPGNLVIDAGEFVLTSTAVLVRWTGSVTITAQVYWICLQTNADTGVLKFEQGDFFGVPWPPLLGYASDLVTAQHSVIVPRTYAPLPLAFPESGLSQDNVWGAYVKWSA